MITLYHFQCAFLLSLGAMVGTALWYAVRDALRERPGRLRSAACAWAARAERTSP